MTPRRVSKNFFVEVRLKNWFNSTHAMVFMKAKPLAITYAKKKSILGLGPKNGQPSVN